MTQEEKSRINQDIENLEIALNSLEMVHNHLSQLRDPEINSTVLGHINYDGESLLTEGITQILERKLEEKCNELKEAEKEEQNGKN